jgi:hypothetical protein
MERIIVQCKKYTPNAVNNYQMRTILNNARSSDHERFLVCTSSDFNSDARITAADNAMKSIKMPV